MAVSKIERLMNLVIALLSTRQYLTADRIRANVYGYDPDASDEAFSRMFERDKAELRDLGIPLETGMTSAFSAVEGYRINRDAYELPDIDLTSEEATAVAVAVQLWESPELASTAQSGLQKLRAAGVTVDLDATTSTAALPARSRGSEPALGKLMAAIDAGRAVRFPHHSAPTEPYTQRDVEPWGIVTRNGRWYLVGHDRDRSAERTFRISRIGDDVVAYGPDNAVRKPDGVDLRQVVDRIIGSPVTGTATVWVADGHAHDLRRLGTRTDRRRIGDRDGDVLELTVRSPDWTARLIAGHGPDVLVLEPLDLRAEVVARLTAAR